MLLSNPKTDYTIVRRLTNVKLSEQTPEVSKANTMSSSTSLQDISSHHAQKFSWNTNNNNNNNNNNTTTTDDNNNKANNNNNDHRLVNLCHRLLSSSAGRQLSSSRSDELIFEHPEVTIKPSALNVEIQKRLSTMKSSLTSENLADRDAGKSVPNILEHPDMRAPVVMQPTQVSLSSSASVLGFSNAFKQISRTQSADISPAMIRRQSPTIRVESVGDKPQKITRSVSPTSLIGDRFQRIENEEMEDLNPPATITTDASLLNSESPSKSDINSIETEKNNFW